jgi:hypothetical protein
MTTTTTISDKAREAYDWFETAERPDGESFVRTKSEAPEWVTELVQDAHGSEFLPDDWRYEAIRDCLGAIATDELDADDGPSEWADGYTAVYNGALLSWLSSNLNRIGYVDDAVAELGYSEDRGVMGAIALGQYMEAREVFELVHRGLEALVDEDEDA